MLVCKVFLQKDASSRQCISQEDDLDNMGSAGSVNKQRYSHNTIYQAKLQVFRNQFPGALIVCANYWNAYRTVIET